MPSATVAAAAASSVVGAQLSRNTGERTCAIIASSDRVTIGSRTLKPSGTSAKASGAVISKTEAVVSKPDQQRVIGVRRRLESNHLDL